MYFSIATLVLGLLTNSVDVLDAIRRSETNTRFRLQGQCVAQNRQKRTSFLFSDSTGMIFLSRNESSRSRTNADDRLTRPGSIVRIAGRILLNNHKFPRAYYDDIQLVGNQPIPPARFVSLHDLRNTSTIPMLIQTKGVVRDVFRDEIDPLWHFIILTDEGSTFYVPVFTNGEPSPSLYALIGAEISVTGICDRTFNSAREYQGLNIFIQDPSTIRVLKKAPDNLFNVPSIGNGQGLTQDDIFKSPRRRISGHVLAVRERGQIVMQDEFEKLHNIELSACEPPVYGQSIEASGHLETDLFHINLSSAVWRETSAPRLVEKPILRLSSRDIFLDDAGRRVVKPNYHGRLVRIRGLIPDISSLGSQSRILQITDGDFTFSIDISAAPQVSADLADAKEIEATGTCVIECENWHSYSKFPHISGVAVVIRNAGDIRILASRPWWTVKRLTFAISALLIALVIVLLWNHLLNRLADRRGHELLHEQIEYVKAELKVDERTRLSVELHDSLAQNLTSAALEIETATQLSSGVLSTDILRHLEMAKRTLASCRNDLRNCLWDLRTQVLEEHDMNAAIRRTLLPHVKNVRTSIRFNIPRSRFTDNTVHDILRIIRELSINAIRHGHATDLRIAGGIEGDLLMFSVTNNGRPFDISSSPGVQQGHFGIQGIRERIRRFNGELTFSNLAAGGIRAKITMRIPHLEKSENCAT